MAVPAVPMVPALGSRRLLSTLCMVKERQQGRHMSDLVTFILTKEQAKTKEEINRKRGIS